MEEEKRMPKEIEHEDCIHTVLIAAGTALLVACLKRAIMVSLVEQWRAWVFVVLNVVLLAILFTSKRSISSEQQESNSSVEIHIEKKKERKECSPLVAVEKSSDCRKLYENRSKMNKRERLKDGVELPRLSKEELNERAEAFIAMFRQHLVSDAKKW
ncbi:hypothetical protein L1049_002678 [Liquidambar formosana]|uniref:Uncharacterized protein n=1 Tax=Liquidambar formosana TaxID=63359 RepID=A0AAP0R6X1_LIQFO